MGLGGAYLLVFLAASRGSPDHSSVGASVAFFIQKAAPEDFCNALRAGAIGAAS